MEKSIEEWRGIAGYCGQYQVSSLGRIKSLGNDGSRKEKILKPGNNGRGYLRVNLYKNGKKCRQFVHRLVAEAFIPNQDNLPQVNHKDENPSNNRLDNLEWCDQKYNNNYGTRNERVSVKLINNKNSSKSVICVETGVIYTSATEAGRQIGANHSDIIKCCREKRKTVKGYHWRYAD